MNDYTDSRHPKLEELAVDYCYICGNSLNGDTTPDHIIPNSLLRKGDPDRPTLPVHHACNNRKSKEDEWCMRFLQFYAGFSPDAQAEFIKLAQKAQAEKPFAFLIGHKNRNYKLAMSLLGNMQPGLEIKRGGESFHEFRVSKKDALRVSRWMQQLCKGLYIRNVAGAHPQSPKLTWNQYALSALKGQEKQFIEPVQRLIDNSSSTSFGQQWGDRVTYIGSRVTETQDKGYIFIHFYRQVGILAAFGVKSSSTAKADGDA